MQFWKSNGDELLFTAELTHHKSAVNLIVVWLDTLRAYRGSINKEAAEPRLDVKATAWTAGFPVVNTEVVFDRRRETSEESNALVEQYHNRQRYYDAQATGETAALTLDFIGPSIDTGFRLCSWSSARKMSISVELAYLLSVEEAWRKEDKPRVRPFYSGAEPLKGVIEGHLYPRFWLEIEPATKLEEAGRLLERTQNQETSGEPKAAPMEMIGSYCEKFFDEHARFMFLPFIFGASGELGLKNENYEDKLVSIYELVRAEVAKLKGAEQSASKRGDGLEGKVPQLEAALSKVTAPSVKIEEDHTNSVSKAHSAEEPVQEEHAESGQDGPESDAQA